MVSCTYYALLKFWSKADKTYSFPVFTEEFCGLFVEEVEHFEASDMPKGRPNTMNNYGVKALNFYNIIVIYTC